jgi:sugar lactone lactonase YvrE
MVKRLAWVCAALVGTALLYLLFWPIPLDLGTWQPPPAPAAEGALSPNDWLAGVEWIGRGRLEGAEAVVFDAAGRALTGTRDGRIVRIEDGRLVELARTGGRPLGAAFLPDGSLAVADHVRGLLRLAPVEPGGRVEVLAADAEGEPLHFTDDVVALPDGTLYFTDATRHAGYRDDFFEHRGSGRLLVRRPGGEVEVVLRGLHFANGLALAPDRSYLLVAETARYRVLRHWLAGPRRGATEPFADNLPGFPDNVTWSATRGVFWVALFAPRVPALDATLPRPFLRAALYRLPRALQPEPRRLAAIVALDPEGRLVDALFHEAPDAYAPVTSAREHDGWLWLGSLEREGLARVRAPPPDAESRGSRTEPRERALR